MAQALVQPAAPPRRRPPDRAAALATTAAPLRRTLVALAGRLVHRRAWEPLGYARLRDYATERLGLSARTVQDWAYVDRALRELPLLDEALTRAHLPWSKVRLLARVATPEDEPRWIARARAVPTATLEREVRRIDVASLEAGAAEVDPDSPTPEDAREGVRIRCTPQVCARWNRARRVASRVAGHDLPMWAAMEAVAAEVASAIGVDPDELDDDEPLGATVAAANRRRVRGRSALDRALTEDDDPTRLESRLPGSLRDLVRGLSTLTPHDLDARLRKAVRREQRFEAQLGPALLALTESRRYRGLGYATFDRYAREQLGMSPRRARALVRIERAGRKCPELAAAYREGDLSWVQAQKLVAVARVPGAPTAEWVKWAQRVTVRRLGDELDTALAEHHPDAERFPSPPPLGRVRTEPKSKLQVCARTTAAEESAHPFFAAPKAVARLFRAVLCSVQRRLQEERGHPVTEGDALGAMIEHALSEWGADDPKIRRSHRVFERDAWRCTVPGCTSYRNLHDHHIRFRSAGGSDELSNRTTLCAWHHQRGVHAGLIRCRGVAPGGLQFELGVQPPRPPLVAFYSLDELTG